MFGDPIIPQPRLFRATGVRVTPKVEWVEVETKSVLNPVRGMGFRWSINPYRGCQHQCVFCLDPATPVLMADGRSRSLGNLLPGDGIVGVTRAGRQWRYVRTEVLAVWRRTAPAFRVVLEDGTELIASGDHRFLTERGWTGDAVWG
jgi:hypothetical protein